LTLLFLGTFISSLLLSFVFTKVVRDVAVRKRWLSAPAGHRHLHNEAIPRLGGVAIVFSFLIATAMALLVDKFAVHSASGFSLGPLATILPPAILIFLLGIYDDRRDASPFLKFSVQAIAGAMLFAGGLRIFALPVLFGTHRLSWVTGLALTIVWVIAITNAFNLIDGLDGLAAGSALFSTLVVFSGCVAGEYVADFSGGPGTGGRNRWVSPLQLQSCNHLSWRLRQSLHWLYVERACALRFTKDANYRRSCNPHGFVRIANSRNFTLSAAPADQRASRVHR
jgi:glycosyl transferase family 4